MRSVAPHHGGKTANTSMLYTWMGQAWGSHGQPAAASSGHERRPTLLEQSGTPLLCTWQRAAVYFQWCSDQNITEGSWIIAIRLARGP